MRRILGVIVVCAVGSSASGQQVFQAFGGYTGGGGAVDTIVYDNSTDILGFLIGGNDEENGDGLTLAGTDRVVTNITLFIHTLGGNGTADAQVRMYVGGDIGGGNPGAVLWESGVFAQMAFTSGLVSYDFAVPNVLVPGELTWTLELTNVSAGNTIGSRFIGIPTVGSSEDWVWNRAGGVWTQENFAVGGNNSYGAIIEAVPTPGSLALLAIGGIVMLRRRR